ncbi:chemotaxis response regulator protein-glutamate methylesterase [Alkalihalobacillus sp. MEB130]|uniref:protein-glutamate methylesterase/protein-glutamine glutaminase n=1 Tax=Alkalihalobacillus sp. MEB130 TaxID=2976704 RepID=UPI0028DF4024|nr:chemotaxis response regulator protein-glutamate methylesterase [Alkalihalobacillus sp. MEB130]MDT8859006.1 chemotaxis response regulator protein-glutamate methylesterase [Alkalihalobacillus sp. MEB130]
MVDTIKILIVDDSAFMRKVISEMLNQHPKMEVIGTARNGQDALTKRKTLRPDVITLDVEMPILNGLDTLKLIMDEDPCPVVMVSSTTKAGAENTLLAIEYGAVDFVTKPSGAISLDIDKVEKQIIEKVLHAAKANVRQKRPAREDRPLPVKKVEKFVTKKKIVAIGTSTGGPRALKDVLTKIPANIEAPILIVQHMPAGFTASLANRLNSLSHIHVKEAQDGEILQNGTAYIAPGGFHLTAKRVGSIYAIHLHQEEARRGHRPSVDVMFESLAMFPEIETIAVIMTGMGADGTEGLMQLKKQGHYCYSIAESEESCTVFGMPKAAIQTKLVDEVVHVQQISERILKRF